MTTTLAPTVPPCAKYPRLFDSVDFQEARAAKAICAECPLRDGWCLDQLTAWQGPFAGTWAGHFFNSYGNERDPNPRKTCRDCDRPLYRGRYRKDKPEGTVQHNADDLCTACYKRARGHR